MSGSDPYVIDHERLCFPVLTGYEPRTMAARSHASTIAAWERAMRSAFAEKMDNQLFPLQPPCGVAINRPSHLRVVEPEPDGAA